MRNLFYSISILLAVAGCISGTNTDIQVSGNILSDSLKIIQINDLIGIVDNTVVCDTVQREDDKLFAYGTYIRLPKLLSKTGEFEGINKKIITDFDSIIKQAEAHPKANKDEFHKITYDNYLHDSIITIKITDLYAWHLSEASTTFTVYHFDYKNNKLLTVKDMFAVFGMSQVPVLSAFAEQCTMHSDNTDPLFNTEWFDKLKFGDIDQLKFYMGNNQKIVIIYPLAENGIEGEQILE